MRPEPDRAVPLQPEDRAILALESPTIAGHTCKVVTLGTGAPDAAALRRSIAERLVAAPLLRTRLGGSAGAPAWVPDERFDAGAHVVDVTGPPLDRDGLRRAVARLFAMRLDRDRPLWRIDVARLEDGGAALVWRIHHALADGTAAMRYARALLWDDDPDGARPGAAPAPPRPDDPQDDARRRRHLAAVLERELAPTLRRSPFDARIGSRRDVAFATTPLAPLHDAARAACGATVNDAVLAVVAGALRSWLRARHGAPRELRVKVPVSLHRPGDGSANRDSAFAVDLPLAAADPLERLRDVHRQVARRKADHDAEALDAALRDLRRVAPGLAHLAERIEASPRRFALAVSNVRGPGAPVSVLGAPVRSLHTLAEIGERHALRVAVISAAGTLGVGLCADPDVVDGLDDLAAAIEREAAALVAAAGGA